MSNNKLKHSKKSETMNIFAEDSETEQPYETFVEESDVPVKKPNTKKKSKKHSSKPNKKIDDSDDDEEPKGPSWNTSMLLIVAIIVILLIIIIWFMTKGNDRQIDTYAQNPSQPPPAAQQAAAPYTPPVSEEAINNVIDSKKQQIVAIHVPGVPTDTLQKRSSDQINETIGEQPHANQEHIKTTFNQMERGTTNPSIADDLKKLNQIDNTVNDKVVANILQKNII
jgi:Na+-transporting methylmalonyl-CoA/oxaloacetate decarboxylase gamma subunit